MLFTHQDTCSSLSLFLSFSLPPSLRYFVAVSREKLEEEAEELRAHQAESQARIESLMEQMMTIEQNMQHEAQARDEEQMQKLRDELEKTRLQQREDESKKLASLAAELKDVKGALDEEKGEKDRLQVEVEQLKADVEAQRGVVEKQKAELSELNERAAMSEKKKEASEVMGVATKQKLQAYASLSNKWRESIMDQCRSALVQLRAKTADSGSEGEGSTANQLLQQNLEKLKREAHNMNVENRKLKRQQHTADAKIRDYKEMIAQLEEKIEEQKKIMDRRVREALKAQQSTADGRVVRRRNNA